MEVTLELTIQKEGTQLCETVKYALIMIQITTSLNFRYSPVNFENIFSKYGKTFPNKLTLREVWNMTEGNRDAFDIFGWYG